MPERRDRHPDPQGQIHQSELNRLLEQLRDVRQALKPFAEFSSALPPVVEGQNRLTDAGPAFACKSVTDPSGEEKVITFADLRRAGALLSKLDSEDEERFMAKVTRAMIGHGHMCRVCKRPLQGTEQYELAGFCSLTCSVDFETEIPP